MLAIDTKILVRFLVRGDETQLETAGRSIRREVAAGRRVFVRQVVLLQTEWVLKSRYGWQKLEFIEAVSALLDAHDVQFEDEPAIEEAVFSLEGQTCRFC